jgi:hypothetical protein
MDFHIQYDEMEEEMMVNSFESNYTLQNCDCSVMNEGIFEILNRNISLSKIPLILKINLFDLKFRFN